MDYKRHILIENIVSEEAQNTIFFQLTNTPGWQYCETTYGNHMDGAPSQIENEKVFDIGHMGCMFFDGKNWGIQPTQNIKDLLTEVCENIKKIDQTIEKVCITRWKANLLWKYVGVKRRTNYPHVDTPSENSLSAVYYANDSDGDTVLFYPEETIRISPKKGSVLLFPSNISHASSNPEKTPIRVVINTVIELFKSSNTEINKENLNGSNTR
jgi:transcription termination factor NusB